MMMNMENIPGGIISGVDDNFLDFLSRESCERYISELSISFQNELNETEQMDKTLSPEQEIFLTELENNSVSFSTDCQTKKWVATFRRFLEEKKLSVSFEEVPLSVLNDYLRLFYASLKTVDGQYYAPASLICIRAALHRHLTSASCNKKINILTGEDFRRANGVLKAMVKLYLNSNQMKHEELARISSDDMRKLKEYFQKHSNDFKVLQQECLFNIIYFFQLRGRENLRSLTKQSIGFKLGDDGRTMAFLKVPLLQKNVKASLKAKEFEDLKFARIVEQLGDDHCPVKRLREYLSHLPAETKDDTLFPKFNKSQKSFSSQQVLGKDQLGSLMSILSQSASLSKRYTNHSLRVIGINVLHENGLSNESIQGITGHKNAKSVRYIRKNEMKVVRACDILAGATSKECDIQPRKVIIQESTAQIAQDDKDSCATCSFSDTTCKSSKIVNLSGVYNNCNFNF